MRKTMPFTKRNEIESKLGMSIADYILLPENKEKTQSELADEWGVQAITVGRWMNEIGAVKHWAIGRAA